VGRPHPPKSSIHAVLQAVCDSRRLHQYVRSDCAFSLLDDAVAFRAPPKDSPGGSIPLVLILSEKERLCEGDKGLATVEVQWRAVYGESAGAQDSLHPWGSKPSLCLQ
jgi:hypothetical protein